MKRVLLTTLFVIFLSLLVTGIAYAQDGSPQSSNGAAVDVAVLLAPLVAAATAVERVIEMIFDWYESIILDLSKFPKQASDYVGWARKEVEKYNKELLKLGSKEGGENDADLAAKLQKAEENLQNAQDRLKVYLSSPTYISWKKKLTLILGIVFGLIIALSAQIQMFSLLGIPIPGKLAIVDTIITGLVIGTGSAPVHSLIGLIQNTTNAVDGARALWSGRAYTDMQRSVMSEMRAVNQPSVMAVPAPLSGVPGAVVEQPVAEPQVSALEMDRMIKRMLRK